MTTQQRPILRTRMSGVIPPDGVHRDGFTVEQHTEQNKKKKKDEDVLSERRNGRQAQVWVTSIAATVRRSCSNTA